MTSYISHQDVLEHYFDISKTSLLHVGHKSVTLLDEYVLEPTSLYLTTNPVAHRVIDTIFNTIHPLATIFQENFHKFAAQSDELLNISIPMNDYKPTVIRNQEQHITHKGPISATSAILSTHNNRIYNADQFNTFEFYSSHIAPTIHSSQQYLLANSPYPIETVPTLDAVVISTLIIASIFIVLTTILSFAKRAIFGTTVPKIPIQILDVATFDAFKPEWRVTNEEWFKRGAAYFHFHDDEIRFMRMISERSGIGYATHFSPGIVNFPIDLSLQSAYKEAEFVMFGCIDKLLLNNNINPSDIDIIVTNCSLFNPTPSIASMIVNHYKMRTDVQTFHLGGMGCSASPLAVNAASTCLRLHPKKHPLAIVVSMENITQNIYFGRDRAFMLQNALFRLGGAAILLTRDSAPVLGRPMPKWTIMHSTHIHTASNTDAYTCVFQDIDKENRQAVRLDKALMTIAAGAITKNLTSLGPKILPLSAQLDYVYRLAKQLIGDILSTMIKGKKGDAKRAPIVPNFKSAVQHFCVHAGGRSVLDAIQQSLQLTDADLRPSRNTLYENGNTSSSSIWYEYRQCLALRSIKKGDVMLQIAVGSGFKANLLTLKALTNMGVKK